MIEVTKVDVRPNNNSTSNLTHFVTVEFSVGDISMYLRNLTVWKTRDGSKRFVKFPQNNWKDKEGNPQSTPLFGFRTEDDSWKDLSNKVFDVVLKAVDNQGSPQSSGGSSSGGGQYDDTLPF